MTNQDQLPVAPQPVDPSDQVEALYINYDALAAQPEVTNAHLADEGAQVVLDGHDIAGVKVFNGSIYQANLALIKPGFENDSNDLYAVLDVIDGTTKKSAFALARLSQDARGRASIIGQITDQELLVGRSHGNAVDDRTSRKHFSARLNEDGKVVITNYSNTKANGNGTEVFHHAPEKPAPTDIEHSAMVLDALKAEAARLPRNPLMASFWGAETSDVNTLLYAPPAPR
jgi:hypothetical protein